jgi:hypothetical protein
MPVAPLRQRTMGAPMEKKTRITRGHLAAWEVTSAVLQEIEREPLARLSGVVEAARRRRARLSRMAGAFDYAGTLQGVAEKIYTVTVACIKDAAPALFDASPEAGKDAKEMVERRFSAAGPAAEESASGVGPARIRELVRIAALERELSAADADAIGDAVVTQLLVGAAPTRR